MNGNGWPLSALQLNCNLSDRDNPPRGICTAPADVDEDG
jgi:hypothetical protein